MDASEQAAEDVGRFIVQVYAIHEVVIQETGGMEGLRDGAMFHASVARPFATFAGEELYDDDFEKAAALFHSLIKSHPFLDGTKRTAFLAALYFLVDRGHAIPQHLPKDEAIRFCLALAEENLHLATGEITQTLPIADIAAWLHWLLNPR
jgi:death on curing protein